MCRSIVTLRGLEPPATADEMEAAARQYVRKVSGVRSPSPQAEAAFEAAVSAVRDATALLLAQLPPRRQPPPSVPPNRLRAAGTAGTAGGAGTVGGRPATHRHMARVDDK